MHLQPVFAGGECIGRCGAKNLLKRGSRSRLAANRETEDSHPVELTPGDAQRAQQVAYLSVLPTAR
jgi:hypothetical protein